MQCPCRGDPCEEEGCNGSITDYLRTETDCREWVKEHGPEALDKWLCYIAGWEPSTQHKCVCGNKTFEVFDGQNEAYEEGAAGRCTVCGRWLVFKTD